MESLSMQSTVNRLPWYWLFLIVLVYSVIGWSLFTYNSPNLVQVTSVAVTLALAGASRTCAAAGFNVWAGAFALTFGTVFILVGVLISMAAFAWAFAVAAVWAGAFALDLALTKAIAMMDSIGFSQTKILWILAVVSWVSVAIGWETHAIIST